MTQGEKNKVDLIKKLEAVKLLLSVHTFDGATNQIDMIIHNMIVLPSGEFEEHDPDTPDSVSTVI